MKNAFIVIIFLSFIAVGYAQSNKGFILKGKIEGLKDGTLLYLTKNFGRDTIERTVSKNGNFSFSGKEPLGAGFYFIKMDTLVSRKPSKVLILVNASLSITSSMTRWPDFDLIGSTPHNEYTYIINSFAKWNKELSVNSMNSLKAQNALLLIKENGGDSVALKREIEQAANKNTLIENERKKFLTKYINNHLNSLYVPNLILKMEGSIFDITQMNYFYDKLSTNSKASTFGLELKERLKIGEIKVGKKAGNFEKETDSGDTLALSDVVAKGKFTLLDFWASWCKPCRAEIPNLRRAYNLYHDKGFNILSITMDANSEDWKEAIRKDTMHWYNIKDTKENSVSDAYNIKALPAVFLLDSNGVVIATGLRGEELIDKLGNLLGE
jgi:thiol-disulfide isomerase/thioredoxin